MDEIFTAVFSRPDKSLLEVAEGPLHTPLPTPPLYFWTVHIFTKIFGMNDWTVRMPSVVAGISGVFAIFVAAEKLFDREIGLWSAFLLAISPLHIFISREARFYAPLVLVSILTMYFLFLAVDSGKRKWWACFVLATIVNIYTHLTALFVLFAEGVFVLLLLVAGFARSARRKNPNGFPEKPASIATIIKSETDKRMHLVAPFTASMGIIVLSYLPMAGFILAGARGERGFGGTQEIEGIQISLKYFAELIGQFGAGFGFALVLYLSLFFWGCVNKATVYKRKFLLFALLFFCPFIVIMVLRPKHWFSYKYIIFFMPVYLMVVSLGIQSLAESIVQVLKQAGTFKHRKKLYFSVAVCFALLFSGAAVPGMKKAYQFRVDRWKSIGQMLNRNLKPDDAIGLLPLQIKTMSPEKIMSYYGPTCEQADIYFIDSISLMEELYDQYKRVWIVIDRRLDREKADPIVAWVESRPNVKLPVTFESGIMYLGKGENKLGLLREASTFVDLCAASYGALAEEYESMGQLDKSETFLQKAVEAGDEQSVWRYKLDRLREASGHKNETDLAPWIEQPQK